MFSGEVWMSICTGVIGWLPSAGGKLLMRAFWEDGAVGIFDADMMRPRPVHVPGPCDGDVEAHIPGKLTAGTGTYIVVSSDHEPYLIPANIATRAHALHMQHELR